MFPNASNGIRAAAASSDPLDFTDSSDLDDIGDLDSQDLLPLLERTPTPPPPLMSRHNPLQVDSMSVRTYSKNKVAPPLHSVAAQRGIPVHVVVEVGPERKEYYVQKAFLTHHSDYFRKALSGTWKEAKDGVVSLDDIEPGVFNLFLEWMYTQQVPVIWADYSRIMNRSVTPLDICKIKLYVFADRFAVPVLRTAMNRQIVQDSDAGPPVELGYKSIIYAFENLPPSDPLLDLFVDRHYVEWSGYKVPMLQLPHDFLLRFFERLP
ncbi:hypothetical protein J4E86_001664 [Alternaria arbusti]|uniref:uncharacterized protein n=1 Tax=Alternaria arbusti TaxID=232088 RepID=UPI002220D30B|nr:uncharacterized protein J4E86_001664 [Alternaria arbusti]KAI4960045.1 hypothetical protein J4E86_001664 [Alternaria arbusti]